MKEKLYTIPLNDAVNANDECPFCFIERELEQNSLDFALPCVSTPADTFLVLRTLPNCLACIIFWNCYKFFEKKMNNRCKLEELCYNREADKNSGTVSVRSIRSMRERGELNE